VKVLEVLWGYTLIVIRICTIFPLLLGMTLFMGRRSIGELPVFDFLIVLALGSVVGADIAEPNIEHLPTAFAVVVIALLQKLVSVASIRVRRFGSWVTFEPTVMIHNGVMHYNNMKKAKYSVDNILQMLRENQVFDPSLVHLAVLEANGKLSVMLQPDSLPATSSQLGLPAASPDISYPVIIEGRILPAVLSFLQLNEEWLRQQLEGQGTAMEDVFMASVDKNKTLALHLYSPPWKGPLPPVLH
jgi:uncharacterized membrane protein YcaP (DUF421 family)